MASGTPALGLDFTCVRGALSEGKLGALIPKEGDLPRRHHAAHYQTKVRPKGFVPGRARTLWVGSVPGENGYGPHKLVGENRDRGDHAVMALAAFTGCYSLNGQQRSARNSWLSPGVNPIPDGRATLWRGFDCRSDSRLTNRDRCDRNLRQLHSCRNGNAGNLALSSDSGFIPRL
jgi:hypothetical protein